MKGKKSGIIIFIILAAIVLICTLAEAFLTIQNMHITDTNKSPFKLNKKPYIAKLFIEGVIDESGATYNQEWLLNTIESLKNDEKNMGIALWVDSPGGTVYEADEAYLALMDYKKATGRPIYVYHSHLAASGGYYISCAGDKIFANRNALVGSIGVIFGSSIDITELLGKLGIKMKTFYTGRNKNMLANDEPLTEEQNEIMNGLVNDAYEQFVSIVSSSRNIPLEKTKEIADGRIYTPKQALKLHLIDKISTFDEMLKEMKEEALKMEDVEVNDYSYIEKFKKTFMDYFFEYILGKSSYRKLLKDVKRFSSHFSLPGPAYLYRY